MCKMKKLSSVALTLGLAISAFASIVPKGTDIRLAFDEDISTKTARVGDRVNLHVLEDIIVQGQVVVKKGTTASAKVIEVQKGRRFGVNARMRLEFDPITGADGTMIPICTRGKGKKTGSKTDTAAIASAGGALVLGPIGLGIGYFVTGKHVNVRAGDTMVTEVAADTDIKN